MSKNQKISSQDLDFIRCLPDWDLIMLLSEIHDHGWPTAAKLIPAMRTALTVANAGYGTKPKRT